MKTELTLPIEMYKLSLMEIGTIFILLSLPHMDKEFIEYWNNNLLFQDTLKKLKQEEIIIQDDNESLEIDLTWI